MFEETRPESLEDKAMEIEWDARFADVFRRDEAGNPVSVDVARVHETAAASG